MFLSKFTVCMCCMGFVVSLVSGGVGCWVGWLCWCCCGRLFGFGLVLPNERLSRLGGGGLADLF